MEIKCHLFISLPEEELFEGVFNFNLPGIYFAIMRVKYIEMSRSDSNL